MTRSNTDTTALLNEIRLKTYLWEQASTTRPEHEAAEAATRAMAELDAALCDGAALPVPWQRAQYPPSGFRADPADTEQHARFLAGGGGGGGEFPIGGESGIGGENVV